MVEGSEQGGSKLIVPLDERLKLTQRLPIDSFQSRWSEKKNGEGIELLCGHWVTFANAKS